MSSLEERILEAKGLAIAKALSTGEPVRISVAEVLDRPPRASDVRSIMDFVGMVTRGRVAAEVTHPAPISVTRFKTEARPGGFYAVEGVVTSLSEIFLRPTQYVCDGEYVEEPIPKAKCRPVMESLVRERVATLAEPPESGRSETLTVVLRGPLINRLRPGERVAVSGIAAIRGSKGFRLYLEATGVEKASEPQLPEPPDLGPNPVEALVLSLAPSIWGHRIVKEAIVLQLFSAPRIRLRDVSVRGNIHILLLGDPGTAKSQLLRAAVSAAPKGILVHGRGASAAGLTAAVVRDEEGRWTLEAGAVVLGSGGLVAVDEIEKMRVEDAVALHEAMEQGTVTISKAGVKATMFADASILAAANPAGGRLDDSVTPIEQIRLPASLLDRFDAIFVTRFPSEAEARRAIVRHTLSTLSEPPEPPVSRAEMKAYIAAARRIRPRLGPGALAVLENAMEEIESRSGGAVTMRQFEAVVRFTLASARARMSPVASGEDARRAINIVSYWLADAAGGNPYALAGESTIDRYVQQAKWIARERGIPEDKMESFIRHYLEKRGIPVGEIKL